MIYEMRTYEAMPGKLRALAARFADVTLASGFGRQNALQTMSGYIQQIT